MASVLRGSTQGESTTPRRRTPVWKISLLFCGSLVFAIGLAELGLRLIDPEGISYFPRLKLYYRELIQPSDVSGLLYEHVPSRSVNLGVDVSTNALGLRDTEIESSKPPDSTRLLVLGDSIAFGWGVAAEDSLPRLLEAALQAKGWRVLNGGVVGYNTVQERIYLEARGLALEPDLIVLVFCGNDLLRESIAPLGDSGAAKEGDGSLLRELGPFRWWAITNQVDLYLMHWLRQRMIRQLMAEPKTDAAQTRQQRIRQLLQRYLQSGEIHRDADRAFQALREMAAVCRARSIPLVVVRHSGPAELQALCREENLPFIDTEFDRLQLDPRYRISEVDAHPNAAGHQRLSDRILKRLRELKLL